MKRLTIFLTFVLAFCGIGLIASSAIAVDGPPKIRGPLANATVSFGQWNPNDRDLLPAEVPLDRLLRDPDGGRGNDHLLIPQIATIKEGGTVNYIISGGHVLAVYDDGTKPEDIGTEIEPDCAFPLPTSGITTPCSPVNNVGDPVAGGILSDANARIYRGAFLNVSPARRDGVEVVQFTKPGTYLVICARKNHFTPLTGGFEMFGFVKVLPGK
jgi:hypothetical protein